MINVRTNTCWRYSVRFFGSFHFPGRFPDKRSFLEWIRKQQAAHTLAVGTENHSSLVFTALIFHFSLFVVNFVASRLIGVGGAFSTSGNISWYFFFFFQIKDMCGRSRFLDLGLPFMNFFLSYTLIKLF